MGGSARGIDNSRVYGYNGWQDHQFQTHTHEMGNIGSGSATIPAVAFNNATGTSLETGPPDPINGGNFGTETRPRNYALVACIKL